MALSTALEPLGSEELNRESLFGSGSGSAREFALESLVAAALALYAILQFTLGERRDAVDFAMLGAVCVALVTLRRSAPMVFLAVAVGVLGIQHLTDRNESYITLALSVALFSVVVALQFWAGTVTWVGISVAYMLTFVAGDFSLAIVGSSFGFFACAWGAGLIVRRHERTIGALRATADEVQATAAAREQMAVMEERSRLRDDLHDIVGHHVNVAAVLADAARTAHGRDDDRLISSLEGIGTACRAALDEMEQATGWLTLETAFEPTPSLADLEQVVDYVRRAGLEVEQDVVLTPAEMNRLDRVLSATATRFVREALTNVLKHSNRRWCRIEITTRADELVVNVISEAASSNEARSVAVGPAGGTGLKRLRRRIELLGGSVTAGPVASGFRQQATFPVRATPQP